MASLKILVTGKSSVTHAPELATLRFSVKGNDSEQDKVGKEVSRLSNNLQVWIKSAFPSSADNKPDAPMTKFSSTSIRTWTKSTGRHDQPLANPYHASISFKAVFQDFAKLNRAIEELLVYPKVEIDSLDWSLTDETGRRLASDARKLALHDAIQQAADYSEVLGCSVSVVEISDQQASPYRTRHLLGTCNSTTPFGDDSPALDLTPQDIDVESEISVTFEAETVTRSAPQTEF